MQLSVVLAVALFVPSCKGKAKDTPAAEAKTTAVAAAPATGSAGDAVWTAAPDPLQQAVLAATAKTAALVGVKQRSLATAVIDAMEAAHKKVSREAWDPAAVIATVGKDRVALFTWVRDRTALVPYRGSLRGAVGVMMDRVGNSLDRALLLADLLGRTGLEVRLANAQLEPGLVSKLADAWKTRPRPALPAARINDAALISDLAKIIGVAPAALQANAAEEKAATDALAARTKTRIEAHSKALAALVPPTPSSAPPQEEAFTDHWWVQVHDGDAWSDLDPSLPTASPGEPVAATATETLVPTDLGDDRRHVLAIRVIGEVWHGDAREEAVLLDHAFAPSLFYGQKITISNVALDLPPTSALLAAPDRPAAVRKALLAQGEFAPLIRIGTQPVIKFSVNDRGELLDLTSGDANTIRAARAVQHATKDGVGGATGLLEQLPADPTGSAAPAPAPSPSSAEKPAFTAEWIELEIRAPGAAPVVVRRTLFDTLGRVADRSAARPPTLAEAQRLDRAYALIGEVEVLPLFAQLPESFVTDRIVQGLIAGREALKALAAGAKLETQSEALAKFASLPGPLYGHALARFTDPAIYLDRLDVLALRQRVVPTSSGTSLRQEVDIVANPVGVWPSTKDARAARIGQGVRDTELEAQIVGCPASTTCARAPSTSELYAATNGKGWSVVDAPQGVAAGDRSAGYAIVAQQSAPRTWWRVDPITGETLGMNPMGGNAGTERVTLQVAVQDNMILAAAGLAKCIYGLAHTHGGTDATVDYVVCVATTVAGGAGGVVGSATGGRAVGLAIQILANMLN
jgi:hypothetical protein